MFGREHGSKPGSGGLATAAETSANRKERLRQLALEKMDLSKDPYFHKTHLGSFECRLCLTLHNNEANYLAHTQGKRHQTNLKARELKEARDREINKPLVKCFMKIGTPGYSVVKQIDQLTNKKSIQFKLNYPDIAVGVIPLYRLMGAFEQRQEIPDRSYQYLVIAAEPYDTIAFKIPRLDIEKDPETGKHGKSIWDEKTKYLH
ncbi:Splicing factor 3A subunit [Entamoeba marina]